MSLISTLAFCLGVDIYIYIVHHIYIYINVAVSCKRYRASLPYIIIVQRCGKQWDLPKFVDVLSVNLGFSRLLKWHFRHSRVRQSCFLWFRSFSICAFPCRCNLAGNLGWWCPLLGGFQRLCWWRGHLLCAQRHLWWRGEADAVLALAGAWWFQGRGHQSERSDFAAYLRFQWPWQFSSGPRKSVIRRNPRRCGILVSSFLQKPADRLSKVVFENEVSIGGWTWSSKFGSD